MFESVVDDVLRNLGEGRRFAPGEEPAFFQKALAWAYTVEIRWVEVVWFLAFVLLVYFAVRALRYAWILARPRRRELEDEEIEAEIADERARRYRLLLKTRMEADGKFNFDQPQPSGPRRLRSRPAP